MQEQTFMGKLWTEIDSSQFDKQFFHSNFEEFCWSPKDNKQNKSKLSSSLHLEKLRIKIQKYNDEKKYNIFLHRFIFHILHGNNITNCNMCNEDGSVFNCFESKSHIVHHDGNFMNNNPNNLRRLCNRCTSSHRKTLRSQESKSEESKSEESKSEESKSELEPQVLLENEIFLEVPNTELLASNKGRIQRVDGKITSGSESKDKRKYVTYKGKHYSVYNLVLQAFEYEELLTKANEIKADSRYPECKDMTIEEIIDSHHKRYSICVDHIDRNPLNNCLENLRWVSSHENNLNTEKVRPVQQFSADKKTFIKEYDSILCAARALKTSRGNIGSVLSDKRKTAGGFFWRYKPEEEEKKEETKEEEIIKNLQQLSLDGRLIAEYISQSEASKATGIGGISSVVQGKRKTAGGFMWRLKDYSNVKISKPILQYSKDGETFIKEYTTQQEAANETNVKSQNISECCYNRQKTAGGFVWKFKEL